jgi:hypothetical protein
MKIISSLFIFLLALQGSANWRMDYSEGTSLNMVPGLTWVAKIPSASGHLNMITRNAPWKEAPDSITMTFKVVSENPKYKALNPGECSVKPQFRFYIQREGDDWSCAGNMASYRWWSNPISYTLGSQDNQQVTVTTKVRPKEWSNCIGAPGTEVPNLFWKAWENTDRVGVTFGACAFGHGVYLNRGTSKIRMIEFKHKPKPKPTPTPTPPFSTPPPTPRPTATATPRPTATPAPTPAPTPTSTPVPTATPRPSPTPTPSIPPSPSVTPTPVATSSPTSTPSPSPTSTPGGSSRAPHGNFKLYAVNRWLTSNDDDLNNNGVDGYVLRVSWRILEPTEGQLDLKPLKDSIAIARAHGKRIQIGIGAQPDFDSNEQHPDAIPAWMVAAIGPYDTHLTTAEGPASLYWMWNKKFQEKWGNFLRALGREFDSEPTIDMIMVSGIGASHLETYVCKKENPEDVAAFESAGGYASWVGAGKAIGQIYAEAWPTKPFLMSLGKPVDNKQGEDALMELCNWWAPAFPRHGGLMNCKWRSYSNTENAEFAIIKQYSTNNPAGYQTGIVSGHGADLPAAMDTAKNLGAYFVQLSQQDCTQANEPVLVEKGNQLKKAYD